MIDVVVDIGNSRIKFARCNNGGLQLPVRALAAADLAGWERLATEWGLSAGTTWAVTSTDANRLGQFREWVASRAERAIAVDAPRKVPIGVSVDEPDRVGVDRLLNALAVKSSQRTPGAAVIVDAGSAVTVDLLHSEGVFLGGTIFPGLRLMALALSQNTAALPLVETNGAMPDGPPGKNTGAAMRLGITYAVAGGIDAIVREMASQLPSAPGLFLTGGDMTPQLAGLLQSRHQFRSEIRPALTLEGLLRAAEALT